MTIWICRVCFLSECKFDDGFHGLVVAYIPSKGCPMMDANIAQWTPTKIKAEYTGGEE